MLADQQILSGKPATKAIRLASLVGKTAVWIAVIDIALIFIFGFLSTNHVFLTLPSFQNLAIDGTEVVLLAVGAAILLGAGEFDISLGANLVLSSVVSGLVISRPSMHSGWIVIPLGGLLAVATGAGLGLVNGLLVTRLRVNSLIATLATLGMFTGAADLLTGGSDLASIPVLLQSDFGTNYLFGTVPIPAIIALVVTVVMWIVTTKTRFGLRALAVGSSRVAADRSGIRTKDYLTTLYVIVGGLAGVAGFVDISRFSTTNIAGHQVDSLAAISGAVIGGTSVFGGRVSIWGALNGAMLAVILQAGLVVIGLQSFYQLIVIGFILLAAVAIDEARATKATHTHRWKVRIFGTTQHTD